MWSISGGLGRERPQAATLPPVFASLAARQINIRRSEVSMIAGPPGAGKSTIALNWAVRSGVGTLYFSADTSRHTMRMRTLAMLTGRLQTPDVEDLMLNQPDIAKQILNQGASHVQWCWESAPTLKDIEEHVEAYREYWGLDPELIVLDNLSDCAFDSGDEWGSLRQLMRECKWWARDTGAAFLVLHHTSEGEHGNPCPPRRSIHGKVAQVPALICTVTSEQPGFMGVCAVKNRYGPAAPNGSDVTWLMYDPATMTMSDQR